jgi:hypothetical protein
VRLIGVLHFWPNFSYVGVTSVIFLPHLVWSLKALRGYSLAVMARSEAARDKDPSIKDVFRGVSSVRDPDTGELALSPVDLRRNTGNFIIAGTFYVPLLKVISHGS